MGLRQSWSCPASLSLSFLICKVGWQSPRRRLPRGWITTQDGGTRKALLWCGASSSCLPCTNFARGKRHGLATPANVLISSDPSVLFRTRSCHLVKSQCCSLDIFFFLFNHIKFNCSISCISFNLIKTYSASFMCEAQRYRLKEPSLIKLDNFLRGEHLYYAHFKMRKPGSKEIKGLAQGSHIR